MSRRIFITPLRDNYQIVKAGDTIAIASPQVRDKIFKHHKPTV
ncbi:hypothetical protein [Anabaena catenula]|nr:hypothetical protein [Anabaena catenula]